MYSSSRHSKPLPLVPPLQRPASKLRLLLISLLTRHQYSHLHRDRVLFRPLRLARTLRLIRLPVRRRECVALDGL